MSFTCAKAFIVASPIRIPVKEPGPFIAASKSILSNVKLFPFND